MEELAWIGNLLLALCGLPLMIEAIQKKKSVVSTPFYLTWFLGELFVLVYAFHLGKLPLIFNYISNVAFLAVVGYYKIIDHKKSRKYLND